ncbi:hypothetical protein [Geomesophilobacter sediminis]|uniref:DUF5666 domain-containing protein n=1 Tax=Geomesophilobacter sediminis TaxID=2798584 RepID=A0A8J7M309_9BACT|nr:hypothetical protein [Geomesophilobacter sediminis]MBJ6727338.1 hypothetical protein [Geomesophilobacter sediminis]
MKWIHRFVRPAVCLFALCALVAGCDRGSSNVGKYVNEKRQADYTELQPGNVCVIKQGTATVKGTYAVEGKTLTIKIENFEPAKGTIEGNTITDNQGEHWVKK